MSLDAHGISVSVNARSGRSTEGEGPSHITVTAHETRIGISSRTSIDLDFSIENDFDDPAEAAQRLESALKRRFAIVGLVVFDFELALARLHPERERHNGVDTPSHSNYCMKIFALSGRHASAEMDLIWGSDRHHYGPQ